MAQCGGHWITPLSDCQTGKCIKNDTVDKVVEVWWMWCYLMQLHRLCVCSVCMTYHLCVCTMVMHARHVIWTCSAVLQQAQIQDFSDKGFKDNSNYGKLIYTFSYSLLIFIQCFMTVFHWDCCTLWGPKQSDQLVLAEQGDLTLIMVQRAHRFFSNDCSGTAIPE